ncbi:MAG: nucleoside triphosphate pyrophosphohydrolase [Oligoflexus sp.]|jgi:MazG family protein
MSHEHEVKERQELEHRATEAGAAFAAFVRTVAALRHPKTGCPWDLEQDHKSLRRFMLEEAYEAAEAMLGSDPAHMLEELGDVLLQVVLNAQLAHDSGSGDIREVVEGINAKMIRRHPHVFAPNGNSVGSAEVKQNWELMKALEKAGQAADESYFHELKKVLPALTQAFKIGKKAKSIQFDWSTAAEVMAQLRSELDELDEEMRRPEQNPERIRSELGDVFFSLAQLSRHLGYEPEALAQEGNHKFLRRFAQLEALAKAQGRQVNDLDRGELEALWIAAKKTENK